ncbi:MAG: divalent-cation tolerance protein CutA [Planctomycetia bacterium]|nr:divalent-cation tolerance protein CutA [Planctomycetia bacterium]
MSDFVQIQVTFPSDSRARELAELLVEQRLVACAQILGPITSFYNWNGHQEEEQETLLLAKTSKGNFKEVSEFISVRHPYECPQIIALPLVCATGGYEQWLKESVRSCQNGQESESKG